MRHTIQLGEVRAEAVEREGRGGASVPAARQNGVAVDEPMEQFVASRMQRHEVFVGFAGTPPSVLFVDAAVVGVVQLELRRSRGVPAGLAGER
jgi:hypothetical protein